MHSREWLHLIAYAVLVTICVPLLGSYIANVYSDVKGRWAYRVFGWLERASYQIGGVDPDREMSWIEYGKALFAFNLLGFFLLFVLQLVQGYLPLNPQGFSAVSWSSAFNTAVSFTTNTNWQGYAGETTMSYLTQMVGLTPQDFLSAATGMSVLLVLVRGLTRKTAETVGNFWVDLIRTVVYLFLPLCIILSLILIGQGVVQTFAPYVSATTLEGGQQMIPMGPVASQIAIKQLGTNGGGFFNANSAHPFENPTLLTNWLEMLSLVVIPAATVYAYGIMIGSKRHAWLLLAVMGGLWAGAALGAAYAESRHNPVMEAYPLLEGKELRFGNTSSILWAVATTATSNGSVNAMHSSLTPLAGGIALFNMMLGEIVFGGVGVGLCSMLMFVLLTVFLSGLMVGRTPEYLGKKIEKREVQWIVLAVLTPGALILVGAGLSSVLPEALSSLANQGPHGLSEILYAFASAAGNNGSAFAGLNANTTYYNVLLGVVMLIGRLAIVLPSLAIAGTLVRKKISPPSQGTFSTNSVLFAVLLGSIIMIIGGLTFFPVLSLGPIVEHFLMLQGRTF